MKPTFFCLGFILCFLLSGLLIFPSCDQGNHTGSAKDSLRGKITISGAFALYPMTVKWAEEFHKLHPGVTINISAGGAGKGMADALSHMSDLGMFSKEISPEEQAKGAWWIAVAKDAVIPTVNAGNPVLPLLKVRGMSRRQFYEIFITETLKTWGKAVGNSNPMAIQAFTRSDACGAADMWARFLNGKTQEDLLGLGLNGDPGVADAVRRNIEAIGYNNLNFVYDIQTRKKYPGLDVVPIDLNDNGLIDPDENFYNSIDEVMKAINDGRYPSPPARDLYLVSGGKPTDKLIITFLQWVLEEGQQYVNESGYVSLTKEKLESEKLKLKQIHSETHGVNVHPQP